jgi:hypothetical protein
MQRTADQLKFVVDQLHEAIDEAVADGYDRDDASGTIINSFMEAFYSGLKVNGDEWKRAQDYARRRLDERFLAEEMAARSTEED